MKNDFKTIEVNFRHVYLSDMVGKSNGLYMKFTDILYNKVYDYFQPMPDGIKGKTKAETYLRKMAYAAHLPFNYLYYNALNDSYNDFSPIIGRCFFMKVKHKIGINGKYKNWGDYYSCEEIYKYEGEPDYDIRSVLRVLKNMKYGLKENSRDEYKKINIVKNWYNFRRYMKASLDQFIEFYNALD